MASRAPAALLLLGSLAAGGAAAAQEIPEFNRLRTPVSPAFVVLGISPAEVERPTTPSAFAVSLLQRGASLDLLPGSFAVETTPFWWRPHPTLGFDDLRERGWRESVVQDLSLSLAVTDSAPAGRVVDDTLFRRIGIGLRTTLVPGEPFEEPRCVAEIEAAATREAAEVGGMVAAAIAVDPSLAADPARLEAVRAGAVGRVRPTITAYERIPECSAEASARRGLVVTGAVAGSLHFPGGRAGAGDAGSAAVWLTPAWLERDWSVAGVLRSRWDDLDADTTAWLVDLGGRATYAHARWAFSAESVYRRASRGGVGEDRVRLSGTFDVRLAGETWLGATFGRDFDPDAPGSLLAILNLQWNVGGRSVPVPPPPGGP